MNDMICRLGLDGHLLLLHVLTLSNLNKILKPGSLFAKLVLQILSGTKLGQFSRELRRKIPSMLMEAQESWRGLDLPLKGWVPRKGGTGYNAGWRWGPATGDWEFKRQDVGLVLVSKNNEAS